MPQAVMMSLDQDTLNGAARSGEMEYAKWPAIMESLLERLNYIVYNEFPLPRPYSSISFSANQSTGTDTSGQVATHVVQTPTTPRHLPPVPPFPGSSTSDTNSHVPDSQPDQHPSVSMNNGEPTPELPVILLQLLNSIINTIRSSFANKPPHTLQRLSELFLDPTKHYTTLPAWMRAVDRVVSVSSTADIFPLSEMPAIVNGVNGDGSGILWSNNNDTRTGDGIDARERDGGLGSDESLGGALLTPIPWLREASSSNEDADVALEGTGAGSEDQGADELLGEPIQISSVDSETTSPTSTDTPAILTPTSSTASEQGHGAGPVTSHSDPLVPDRPSGAVTQGELMRMEQEAGVVPVNTSTSSSALNRIGLRTDPPSSIALGVGVGLAGDPTSSRKDSSSRGDEDDVDNLGSGPHARGPDVVGTVDMGLVGGRDMQLRLGSPPGDSDVRKVDPNDAQDVLAGGKNSNKSSSASPAQQATTGKMGRPTSDEYVHIAKDGDEMQVDSSSHFNKTEVKVKSSEEDEDVVLVDADGLTDQQRITADASDLNVGADTTDGTGQ